mmetsp:Transcript_3860/g.8500  ORF Transcript_3860/g.8500 Transcript_3860/m.8500 type:complete len:1014 (+) Transcript_3860:3-3044(+)
MGLGFSVGLMLFSFYAMYGVSTWAGAEFILESRRTQPECLMNPKIEGCFTGGKVVTTFVAVILGALSVSLIGPTLGQLVAAMTAAAEVYTVIDRTPVIDTYSEDGHRGKLSGKIEFRSCTFCYPSRPDAVVLKDFSLVIEAGETVALVGQSGSGKSTIIGLLERFYDLISGEVLVDGVAVKDWNLRALRSQIGLVQQESVTFGVSILENIMMGDDSYDPDAEPKVLAEFEARAIECSKMANSHVFISKLPDGYRTLAGTSVSNTRLSGGQRQRVCIARAIMRSPGLLLLDEATSALDTESERIVQASLDVLLSKGGGGIQCTTIMIAHRLSTVTAADKIVVLDRGVIVEMGSHSQLMAKVDGLYKAMRQVQDLAHAEQKAQIEDDASAQTIDRVASAASDKPAEKAAEPPKISESESHLNSDELRLEEAKELPPVPMSRIWALQKDEWLLLTMGCIGALGGGTIQPIFSLVYAGIITTYFMPDDKSLREGASSHVGYFFVLAGCVLVTVWGRIAVFTRAGETLTRKLRRKAFEATLRMPMCFFDEQKNSIGRLTTRLATDASLVKEATGDSLGSVLEGIGALTAAMAIAYSASWRLALVLTAVFPFLILGSIFEFKNVSQQNKASTKLLERAGEVLSDAVQAVKVVTAFNLQNSVMKIFDASLVGPLEAGKQRAFAQGGGATIKQFTQMCSYSLAFYAGSRFIADGTLEFPELIRVFLAITLSSEGIGRITSSAPDRAKAQASARAIFYQINTAAQSPIDPLDDENGDMLLNFAGKITLRNVSFAYPSRPDVMVLKRFNLEIMPGETVALVGESGSGKSTIVQLVQRFYDATEGEVLIDDLNIKAINVPALRQKLGLVQQEPVLFADSIAYNIGYGVADATKPLENVGCPLEQQSDKDKADKEKTDTKKSKPTAKDKEMELRRSRLPVTRTRTISSRSSSTATRPTAAPAGTSFRAGSDSGWRSRGQSCGTRASSSSTRRRRRWTASRSWWCRRPSTVSSRTESGERRSGRRL